MGTMTIDGRKVEFTDEKNVLTLSVTQALIFRHCAIIQSSLHLEHAVYVQ